MSDGKNKAVLETPLDLAFFEAQQDQEQTPAFFEALFEATLFLPIKDDIELLKDQPDGGRSVMPIFYEVDGSATVLVFDTENRLASFVDEPVNYIGLPGRDLFRMFSGGEQIGVNLSVAPSSVILQTDQVAWLHSRATEAVEMHEVNAGASLRLSHPNPVDPKSIAALTSCLAGLRDSVAFAVLVRVEVEGRELANGETASRLVLAMAPTESGKVNAEEVAQNVAQAATHLAGAEAVEISVFDEDSQLMQKARAVGLPLPILDIDSAH